MGTDTFLHAVRKRNAWISGSQYCYNTAMWRCNPNDHPCGQCNACCVVFRIDETQLEKEQFVPCSNLGAGDCGACTIYENRPEVCSEYQCGYLAARKSPFISDFLPAFLEDEFRPDKVGIVFDRGYQIGNKSDLIEGTSVWPNAHESPDAMRLLRELSRISPVLVEAVQRSAYDPEIMEPSAYHWFIRLPNFENLVEKVITGMNKMKQRDPETPPIYLTTFLDHGHESIRLV